MVLVLLPPNTFTGSLCFYNIHTKLYTNWSVASRVKIVTHTHICGGLTSLLFLRKEVGSEFLVMMIIVVMVEVKIVSVQAKLFITLILM
jgi:hypothetical protein